MLVAVVAGVPARGRRRGGLDEQRGRDHVLRRVDRSERKEGDDDAGGHRGRGEHDRGARELGREQPREHADRFLVRGRSLGGQPRDCGDAHERGECGDHEHERESGVRREPDAEWKTENCRDVDDEAVEAESFTASLGWSDECDERAADYDDDRESRSAHERDRGDGGHRVRGDERERGRAKECESGGEGDAIPESRDDARGRELGGDGGEHERAGGESGADAARADRGRVLRDDGEEEIKADHRAEARRADEDHRAREERGTWSAARGGGRGGGARHGWLATA